MKVYVLLAYEKYEPDDILGVYSSLEEANKVIDKGDWLKNEYRTYERVEIMETELDSGLLTEIPVINAQ